MNLGYTCNQSCLHCHVNAGPTRTEQMDRETANDVLAFLKGARVSTLDLTGARQPLGDVLCRRAEAVDSVSPGITITIGNEHSDPRLDRFTLVTGEYRAGQCTGVIGVIDPTRMPYDKVIALVSHTSRLLTELLD